MTAVLTGRLKVSDMAVAMQMQSKLQALFDRVPLSRAARAAVHPAGQAAARLSALGEG